MNKDMNEKHDKKVNSNTDSPPGKLSESDATNAPSKSDPRKKITQSTESGTKSKHLRQTNCPSGQLSESDATNAPSKSDPSKKITQSLESSTKSNPTTSQSRQNSQGRNASKKDLFKPLNLLDFKDHINYEKYLLIVATDKDKEHDISKTCYFKIINELKEKLAIEPDKVRKQNNKTIFIEVSSKANSEKLKTLNQLNGKSVKVFSHKSLNSSRGVIKTKQFKDTAAKDVVENLKEQGVTDAYNITYQKGDNKISTDKWTLTFNTPTAPPTLKVPGLIVKVEPYIPKPMTCKSCLRIGHTYKKCKQKNEDTCPKCGDSDAKHKELWSQA